MAINKITPRALDKSSDYKVVPATAFIDAVNVVFGEDSSNNNDESGDAGVIKNLLGNTALSYHTAKDAIATGDFKIIGTTTDHKLKLIYFFVYHEDLNEQGVWVYDPYGKLSIPAKWGQFYKNNIGVPLFELEGIDPYQEGTIKCVVKGDFFNFKQHSVVQGSIVYGNTLNLPEVPAQAIRSNNSNFNGFTVNSSDRSTFEKDFHVYFTDNVNEPKKISVAACMVARHMASDTFEFGGVNAEFAPLDFNGNGVIDEEDRAIWGETFGHVVDFAPFLWQYEGQSYFVEDDNVLDLNGDGTVDNADLLSFISLIGSEVVPATTFPAQGSSFQSFEGGFFSIPPNNASAIEKIKFCHACKPTPLKRPTFEWAQDVSSKSNNFEKSEGFKFAYQVVYNDGSTSAISPKSELAVTPSLLFQGSDKNPDHSLYNVCRINISDPIIFGLWSQVKQVNILAQEGIGPYKIIYEANGPLGDVSFDFKNDVIGIPVSEKEENKFFDSVPQKAEAQAVVDNRLMYGNYVEGYPNEPIAANLSVQYAERRDENFATPIKVERSIISETPLAAGEIKQKMAGFRITVDNFPSLSVNDTVLFSLSFLPEKNFHVYNATNSYHQSRHLGVENSDDENLYHQSPEEAGAFNISPQPNLGSGVNIPLSDFPQPIVNDSFNAFKDNGGVASVFWKTVDTYSVLGLPGTKELQLGTSAANPFIIPSNTLKFEVKLRCIQGGDEDTLKAAFLSALDEVFATGTDAPSFSNSYFALVESSPYATINWDFPLESGQRIEDGGDISKNIVMLAGDFTPFEFGSESIGMRCQGAVIAKKGSATFGLRKTDHTSESAQDSVFIQDVLDNNSREYKIILDSVPTAGLELWTCIRKWMPGSPWWVLDPSFLSQVSQGSASLDPFYATTEFNDGTDFGPLAYVPPLESPLNPDDGVPIFRQFNSAYDFNCPEKFVQGNLTSDFEEGSFTSYKRTDIGDNTDFWQYTASFIGYVASLNTLSSAEGTTNYFISSPSPKLIRGGVQGDVSGGALYSVMDGEGGPGGSLPGDNLSATFEYPASSNFKNPILNALNSASSAFGFPTPANPTAEEELFYKIPSWFGPLYTGKIHSNTFSTGIISINDDAIGQDFGVFYDYGRKSQTTDNNLYSFGGRTTMPLMQGPPDGVLKELGSQFNTVRICPVVQIYTYRYQEATDELGNTWEDYPKLDFSFRLANSFMNLLSAPSFQVISTTGGTSNNYLRSFKSSSDHDFGIVFYDSHGRRSFVNPLGSVYVDGFSQEERGGNKGSAAVSAEILGNPPDWASKYQFVYSGNKTAQDFVQYTTNNAFIEPTNDDDVEGTQLSSNGKIYVSLNMLQSSSISYAKEFGARGEDGSLSIYKFSEGDKLRVISYGDDDSRSYPNNAVFEIIELVSFDPLSAATNPLIDDIENASGAELFGDFVVLSNNESASNFSYSSMLGGTSYWDQGVVFEIFSPKKAIGIESQVYEEIGEVYDIVDLGLGTRQFSQNPVVLYEGDVIFRPTACNLNLHESSAWTDLLSVDTDGVDGIQDAKSNFKNIALESTRPTDLFPSDIKSLGRANVASNNAKTVRREAGIIYSEKSNPESDVFNYSSFNASLFPFKDLEERFGNINFMDELGGNLFVIQQDRCTMVPVSATLLANVTGQEQLIASNDILGKERVYSIKAGCDNNPESVVRIDNTYYFAHKSSGKIFRFVEGQGIEEISDVMMSSYIRSKFKEAISLSGLGSKSDVRIVGGYDPVKGEYLVTILRPKSLNSSTSDDEVIVYGCTDPQAINYNPDAVINDGSCIPAIITSNPACAEISQDNGTGTVDVDFGEKEKGSLAQISAYTIKNSGETDLVIGSISVKPITENSDQIFDASLGSYFLAPGEFTNVLLQANCNIEGIFQAEVEVLFVNSSPDFPCFDKAIYNVSVDIQDDITDSVQGVVTINFYLGGTLIDQQFADLGQGTWTVEIDQNRVIQSVQNTYSGNGSKALLEVEIEFDDTLGAVISDDDQISITGEILNGLDGFEFLPL